MQVNESIERNISWGSNLMNIMMVYFANLAGISGGLERTYFMSIIQCIKYPRS